VRKDITVAAEVRASRGKNEARRTRRAGNIPAVVYGAFQDPVSVAVSPREISKIIRSTSGYNTIFNLAIAGGETTPVMLVDQQVDPIKGTLLHADLKRIDLTKRIRVTVPVHTSGEPKGVKVQGGILEFVRREIQIECLPSDIPEHVDVDVTELMVGQGIRLRDVATSPKWRPLTDGDAMLVHVILAKAEEAAAAATTEAAATPTAEPEVIKKGKKEEAEAAEKKK
jgi:large subunit ribosomal protein L25